MIKVAYLALAPFISGSERCLQLMIENAEHVGIEPILFTPSASPLKKWAQINGIKHYSVNINSIDTGNLFNIICNQLKLTALLKLNKIDIIHSNQIWSFKALDRLGKLLHIPRICHFRDPINAGSHWWLQNKFDAAIFISKHIEQEFNQQFTSKHAVRQITLMDPVKFIPQIPFDSLDEKKYKARKQLNISAEKFTFGCIGQIAPVKGHVELLQVLAKVENKNWLLIIAGIDPSKEQSYIARCKAEIQRLNLSSHVQFIGFVDDTQYFYAACDLITMFSHKEPLGLIPLEAAVNYTPTIANRVGGLPETILDRKTGWLVDIESIDETVKTIEDAMRADFNQMGVAARQFVESKCLPTSYMEKLAEIYKGCQ